MMCVREEEEKKEESINERHDSTGKVRSLKRHDVTGRVARFSK